MKKFFYIGIFLSAAALAAQACGTKEEKGESKNQVKEKVKEVVTQPFKTYEAAKESLNASGDKNKAALDDLDKELKH